MMYKIMWEIDVDAETPHEAAMKALTTQLDPASIATVFDIYHGTSGMFMESVDLMNEKLASFDLTKAILGGENAKISR